MSERSFTVAAVVLVPGDGAALLQHRDDEPGLASTGLRVMPGGRPDPGESAQACARRDFFEETGYRPGALHPLTEFIDVNAAGFPPLRLIAFWSRYDGVQSVVCHVGQALQFIPRERAPEYAIPSYIVDLWNQAREAACVAATPR